MFPWLPCVSFDILVLLRELLVSANSLDLLVLLDLRAMSFLFYVYHITFALLRLLLAVNDPLYLVSGRYATIQILFLLCQAPTS